MPNVKGRLKANVFLNEETGASNWVLKILREGYALLSISEPEPRVSKNNSFELKNKDFVIKSSSSRSS